MKNKKWFPFKYWCKEILQTFLTHFKENEITRIASPWGEVSAFGVDRNNGIMYGKGNTG